MGDILSTIGGAILSTVGDNQYHGGYLDASGGYHEYRGSVQYHGDIIFCNFSTVGNIMIHVGDIMSTVGGEERSVPLGTQITKDCIPHGTEHPHVTHDIPHLHYGIPPRH